LKLQVEEQMMIGMFLKPLKIMSSLGKKLTFFVVPAQTLQPFKTTS